MSDLKERLGTLRTELMATKPEAGALLREAMSTLTDLEVKVEVRDHKIKELVSGLSYYADPVTWLQVPTRTLASVDRGTKARDALRITSEDPNQGA